MGNRGPRVEKPRDEFDRKVVSVRRVAKVGTGSKRLRFSALVVAGNRKGTIGVGLGRGQDTKRAIEKGFKYAKSHSTKVEIMGDTIPHEVFMKYRAAKLIIKPAGPGTGLIASSAVRSVLELAGIRNVLSKQLGSSNEVTNAYCAYEALKSLRKTRILEKRNALSPRRAGQALRSRVKGEKVATKEKAKVTSKVDPLKEEKKK
jgi:small subunit ribosomal protein S5